MARRQTGQRTWRSGRLLWVLVLTGLSPLGCGSGNAGGGALMGNGGAGGDAPPVDGAAPPDGAISNERPQPAFPIFDDTRMHDVTLTMAPADWQSILDDSGGDDWRHATFTYDGVVVEDVGARPSGESSRFPGNPKMSVRIKFDAFGERGTFGGLKEVKLKGQYGDQSLMRDRLAFFVFRPIMPTPQQAHARMVVNGDLRGLYSVVEVWDSKSIKEHFSEPVGPLYRLRGVIGTDPYAYISGDPAAYVPLPWEPHIDHPSRGDEVIGPFLQTMATAPAKLADVADIDTLLGFLAANVVVMNTDGLIGDTGVEDHFQYFDPASGKFFILPWDPDNTFSSAAEMPNRGIYARFSKSVLTRIVRDTADFRARYKAKITAVMAAVPASAVQAEVDRIYQQIKDVAHEDPYKGFSNAAFDWNPAYLKSFISARYANVADQVANGP